MQPAVPPPPPCSVQLVAHMRLHVCATQLTPFSYCPYWDAYLGRVAARAALCWGGGGDRGGRLRRCPRGGGIYLSV